MNNYYLLLLVVISSTACASQNLDQNSPVKKSNPQDDIRQSKGLACESDGSIFYLTKKLVCKLDKTNSPTGKTIKVNYNPITKKFYPANVAKQVLKCQFESGNFQIKVKEKVWWQMNTKDAPLLPCIIQTS